MMDDPAVFTNFVRNTPRVTTQQIIDVITKFVEYFGDLITVNDIDINTSVKDTQSTNNTRASAHIILISNNVTQGLKSMFLS